MASEGCQEGGKKPNFWEGEARQAQDRSQNIPGRVRPADLEQENGPKRGLGEGEKE